MQKKLNRVHIIYGLIVTLLLLAGVAVAFLLPSVLGNSESKTSLTTNNHVVSNNDNIYTMHSSSLTSYPLSDSQALAEDSQYIAIVKIDSIDGVDNYSEVTQDYTLPYSYGKMTIMRNLVGDLPTGKEVIFYRLGGAIDIDKYYDGLSDSEKERFDNAKLNDPNLASADKIQILDENDINIEVGKTYLAYIVDDRACKGIKGTYAIIGFKGGLREVQSLPSDEIQTYATMDIKIRNNFTGDWENLSEVVIVDR